MRTEYTATLASLASITLLVACESTPDPVAVKLQASSFANSEWSTPANLGPAINTAAIEANPTLSPDELSLYFQSDRSLGHGGTDIWVSRRACETCPWEEPENLGSLINTSGNEGAPSISLDGHLLFFYSTGLPGGQGAFDIYVSRRADPKDDFGWGPAVNLGTDVNTAANEAGPEYLQSAEDGTANLYFGRQPIDGTYDMYVVAVTRQGEPLGPATPVAELNTTAFTETGPTLRTDGREVLFFSARAPTLGMNDFWVSTRRSVHEPWSEPVHLDAPLSSAFNDRHPSLSGQGRTLVFASNRPTGGFGQDDIWMATRTPSGQ
jgi:hypothetical protein